jgi:hypothetical protein
MGFLDQMAQMLGGPEHVERFAKGQMDFDTPNSQDFQTWTQLVGSAPPAHLEEAFTEAARQVDPQAYSAHITPGVGGTDPLGGLGRGALGGLAGALAGNLMGGGGRSLDLRQMVPGLRTTDPQQMSPEEVAALADYTRQHDPEAFGRAAAQVGQQTPGLLQQLLGNKALMLGAAALAAQYLNQQRRNRQQAG